MRLVAAGAVEDAADDAQDIDRRNHDRCAGDDRHDAVERVVIHESAVEDRHFGDETAQTRQSEVRQTCDYVPYRQEGHHLHQAAQLADVARVRAAVDHTDQGEEEGRHQAVAQHLQNGARAGRSIHHQDSEQDQSAVRYRGVGVDIFEVGLHAGRESAVHDRNRREDDENPAQFVRRFGHQVHRHAEAAVAAQLHQHAGVEHRHGGRCRCVTVGAPGVEREEGAQHAEADEDHREPDVLLREGNVVQRGDLVQVHRLRPGTEVDAQDAAEQHCRNIEEVMQMFSKELLELDRNTVKLMIDDMQKEIDCQREQLSQKDEEMLEMRKEIQRLQQLLDKK